MRFWRVIFLLGLGLPVQAQEEKSAEDRIRELERRLEALEERMKHVPEPSAKDVPLQGISKEGLKFKSADGNFEAHVGGRLLAHGRFSNDRPDGTGSSPDGFFVRQARLETSGKFWKEFEYKVQADFPTGGATTSGTLQDAYLGWVPGPLFNVRVGQFKEPFSLEETTSTRFIDFVERSNANRLAPARDIGIMAHGKPWEGYVEYEAGLFNGRGRALLDTDDEKEVAGRVRVSPFKKSDNLFFKGLRLGVAATYSAVDAITLSDVSTTETAMRFLDLDGDVQIDDHRSRLGGEVLWRIGPVSLSGEYIGHRFDIREAQPVRSGGISAHGGYVAATWLITGEDKPIENRIVPKHPFKPSEGDWGALEFAARYSSLSFEEEIFAAFYANDTGTRASTNEVDTLTAGFNWWLTQNVRVSLNYVHDWYEDKVRFDQRSTDEADAFLVRFQVDF